MKKDSAVNLSNIWATFPPSVSPPWPRYLNLEHEILVDCPTKCTDFIRYLSITKWKRHCREFEEIWPTFPPPVPPPVAPISEFWNRSPFEFWIGGEIGQRSPCLSVSQLVSVSQEVSLLLLPVSWTLTQETLPIIATYWGLTSVSSCLLRNPWDFWSLNLSILSEWPDQPKHKYKNKEKII